MRRSQTLHKGSDSQGWVIVRHLCFVHWQRSSGALQKEILGMLLGDICWDAGAWESYGSHQSLFIQLTTARDHLGWPTRAFTHDEYLWKDLYCLVHTGKVPRQSRDFIPSEVSISQLILSCDDLPLTSPSTCRTWWDPASVRTELDHNTAVYACYRTAYLIWGKYTHVDKQRLSSLCCTKISRRNWGIFSYTIDSLMG